MIYEFNAATAASRTQSTYVQMNRIILALFLSLRSTDASHGCTDSSRPQISGTYSHANNLTKINVLIFIN